VIRFPRWPLYLDSLNKAEEAFARKFDMVVDLDITSPLRTVQDVKNAIDRKKQRNDVDVVY
jgi:CMP-N,N'-diacetyllegionaminic acid synthase